MPGDPDAPRHTATFGICARLGKVKGLGKFGCFDCDSLPVLFVLRLGISSAADQCTTFNGCDRDIGQDLFHVREAQPKGLGLVRRQTEGIAKTVKVLVAIDDRFRSCVLIETQMHDTGQAHQSDIGVGENIDLTVTGIDGTLVDPGARSDNGVRFVCVLAGSDGESKCRFGQRFFRFSVVLIF